MIKKVGVMCKPFPTRENLIIKMPFHLTICGFPLSLKAKYMLMGARGIWLIGVRCILPVGGVSDGSEACMLTGVRCIF